MSDPAVSADSFLLDCRGRILDARPGRALIMGVLNVTPDSFSDGGRFQDPGAALVRAAGMMAEGAAIVDVGGASSRPSGRTYGAGAAPVPPDEEIRRVVPVVRRIARELPGAVISVDTVHAVVARAALDAGAHVINDITGLRHDPELAGVIAEAGAAAVLMHSVGRVGELVHEGMQGDAADEVLDHLARARDRAREAGIRSLVLDPGFGFGKTPGQNLRLIARTDTFVALGHPVLVAVSRKSTIGVTLASADAPRPVDGRLFGSLGATAVAVVRGASIVRTHDVAATRDLLALVTATLAADGRPSVWRNGS